jgi:hypothetical protein
MSRVSWQYGQADLVGVVGLGEGFRHQDKCCVSDKRLVMHGVVQDQSMTFSELLLQAAWDSGEVRRSQD